MRVTALILLLSIVSPIPQDLDDLRRRLKDRESDVRAAAVKTLLGMDRVDATGIALEALTDENAYVRDICYTHLLKIRNRDSISLVLDVALKHPDPSVRRTIAEWAGDGHVESAVPILGRLLRDRSAGVRHAAATSLSAIGSPDAIPYLEKALKEKRPDLRAQVLLSLGAIAGKGAAEPVRKALDDRAHEMRVAALLVAADVLGAKDAASAGAAALDDKAWPVRAASIHILGGLKETAAVAALIRALRREGRLQHDAYASLRRLTGKDIPLDAGQWEAWWELNRETFTFPDKAPSGEDPQKKTRTRLLYHGVPVVSRRVAFVLDLSGSMRDPGPGGRPRIDLAREELCRVIQELPDKALFNIYFYNEEVQAWQKRATPATPKSRKGAQAFVMGKAPRGYTNLHGALVRALADEEIDTLYLLSDGGPSRGDVIFTERILRRIEETNRIRRVVIHTVDTGSKKHFHKILLKGLPGGSGGEYVRLGEEGE